MATPPVKHGEVGSVASSRWVPGRHVRPEGEGNIERREAGEIANLYGRW